VAEPAGRLRVKVKAGSAPLTPPVAMAAAENSPFAPWGGGGYSGGLEAGAAARRLRNFRPGMAHVNTLVARAGATVTQRARWLTRNNAYAINAVDWWGNTVVGPGISPSWQRVPQRLKSALRQTWDDWTDQADAEGLTDLYGMQRRAARELFIAGEVFVRIRYRRPGDGLIVPLQLQMLPSEMLDTADNRRLPGGRRTVGVTSGPSLRIRAATVPSSPRGAVVPPARRAAPPRRQRRRNGSRSPAVRCRQARQAESPPPEPSRPRICAGRWLSAAPSAGLAGAPARGLRLGGQR